MSQYGIPNEMGSDNGPPYSSHDLEKFAKYMGYQHNKKIPYAPWANGQAETFMRSLKKLMQTCEVEKKNWKQQLHRFLRSYRASRHKSTGFAPATVMFNGRKYKTRLPTKKKQPSAYHEEVKERDHQAKEVMKRYADSKGYVKMSDIKVGDLVLVKQMKKNKITPPWDPVPYKVLKREGSKIVAAREGHKIMRHVNHFKMICKRAISLDRPLQNKGNTKVTDFDLAKDDEDTEESIGNTSPRNEDQNSAEVTREEVGDAEEPTCSRRILRTNRQKPLRYREVEESA